MRYINQLFTYLLTVMLITKNNYIEKIYAVCKVAQAKAIVSGQWPVSSFVVTHTQASSATTTMSKLLHPSMWPVSYFVVTHTHRRPQQQRR